MLILIVGVTLWYSGEMLPFFVALVQDPQEWHLQVTWQHFALDAIHDSSKYSPIGWGVESGSSHEEREYHYRQDRAHREPHLSWDRCRSLVLWAA